MHKKCWNAFRYLKLKLTKETKLLHVFSSANIYCIPPWRAGCLLIFRKPLALECLYRNRILLITLITS